MLEKRKRNENVMFCRYLYLLRSQKEFFYYLFVTSSSYSTPEEKEEE